MLSNPKGGPIRPSPPLAMRRVEENESDENYETNKTKNTYVVVDGGWKKRLSWNQEGNKSFAQGPRTTETHGVSFVTDYIQTTAFNQLNARRFGYI